MKSKVIPSDKVSGNVYFMIVYINDLGGLVLLSNSFEDGDENFKIWEDILDNAEQLG